MTWSAVGFSHDKKSGRRNKESQYDKGHDERQFNATKCIAMLSKSADQGPTMDTYDESYRLDVPVPHAHRVHPRSREKMHPSDAGAPVRMHSIY